MRKNKIEPALNNRPAPLTPIAKAIERIYVTLNEVADVTLKEPEKPDKVPKTFQRLGEAAKEINNAADLIKGIVLQTNLLALNAAFETAKTNEATGYYAVTTKEVDELSKQTATATEEIREKFKSMHENNGYTVNAMESIIKVITEINSIVDTIAVPV